MNLWVKLRLDAIVREVEKNEGVSISYAMNATEVLWYISIKSTKSQELVKAVLPVDYKSATSPDMPRFLEQTIEEIAETGWLEND